MAEKPTFALDNPNIQWDEIRRLAEAFRGHKGETIKNLLNLIENDFRYRENRSLSNDFAKKLSRPTSLSNLGKICQDVIKMPPSECLKARLIMEACNLLFQQPELTINDISFELGFKDPSYFSRYFKTYTKKAPNLARKEAFEGT